MQAISIEVGLCQSQFLVWKTWPGRDLTIVKWHEKKMLIDVGNWVSIC